MLPTRYWQDLPWPAFRDLPPNTVAVLPVASIEQHGPHLPVSVDTTINQGVVARTL
jgi:creatinine amidohydrolase